MIVNWWCKSMSFTIVVFNGLCFSLVGTLVRRTTPNHRMSSMRIARKWTVYRSIPSRNTFSLQARQTRFVRSASDERVSDESLVSRLSLCGIFEIWNWNSIHLNRTRMRSFKCNGHSTMKLFWLQVAAIVGCMSGIWGKDIRSVASKPWRCCSSSVKLVKNKLVTMRKMDRQNFW